jgi:3-phenylpropionate/cinnamic acid dioxygenase small subunit
MADHHSPEFRLAEFVYLEARLLDEKRFDAWYELFTDDARYWMPLTRGQPDGRMHTSLFYEDKLLLKLRIERLRHPNAFSQQQPSYCQHVLQQPALEQVVRSAAGVPVIAAEFMLNAGDFLMRTPFMYVETQLDTQIFLAGIAYHHLTSIDGTLRIRMKKIELLNCDAALPSIQLLI